MIDVVGNRTPASLLAYHARVAPNRPFLIFEDAAAHCRQWTYAEFSAWVDAVGAALTTFGLRPGAAFTLHLPNCPEFLALWFAAARFGYVMVPTNVALTADEMAYIVEHSESRLIITDATHRALARQVADCCLAVSDVLTIDGDRAPGLTVAAATVPPAAGTADSVVALLYTSGTTAKPKGCLITQAAYVYAGECMAKATRAAPNDRHLVVLPLFHAGAQTHSVMPALVSGGSIALMHRFSASRYLDQARRHHCTLSDLFAAPIRMVLAQPPAPDEAASGLRLVTFAQNITPAELAAWRVRTSVPLMQLWGMTETVGLPLMNPLDDERDVMSLGLPVLGYTVRVVDPETGTDVEPGETGHLLVGGQPGRSLMVGYFKDPEATARTIQAGWLHTGDVVRRDANGYLYFVDRAKDVIKRAGVNIAASEIEAVLKAVPGVFDAAVVSVPDPVRDEAIVAFLIPKEGLSIEPEAVEGACQERLAAFKRPERVHIVTEFPRTPVGKIQKHLLRQQAIDLATGGHP